MDGIDEEGAPEKSAGQESSSPTDQAVGHGSPPMQRRFKKDAFGKKGGRPRGSKNRKTILREIANEMHTVTEGGKQRRRSKLALVLLALRNFAVEGNVRAARAYDEYLDKFQPRTLYPNAGYLVVPAKMSDEEWVARELELNKTRKPPPGIEDK